MSISFTCLSKWSEIFLKLLLSTSVWIKFVWLATEHINVYLFNDFAYLATDGNNTVDVNEPAKKVYKVSRSFFRLVYIYTHQCILL